MSERFAVGDVVVLNGHRLTVELPDEPEDGDEDVMLRDEYQRRVALPAELLPDPEPREEPEPEWQQGDVVQDAVGEIYLYADGTWWSGSTPVRPSNAGVPVRPLARLVPEGSEAAQERAAVVTWLREAAGSVLIADAIERGEHLAAARDGGQGTLRREAEGGDFAVDLPATTLTGPALTYDDSEGDLERLARDAAALTPGQPVAHRDGRLGVYFGRVAGNGVWRPFGDDVNSGCPVADLRPVSLGGFGDSTGETGEVTLARRLGRP